VTSSGLTSAEAAASRAKHGNNELTGHGQNSFWRQFISGFGDPIIKVLLAALAVNVLFFFHRFDWYESAGIALAIFLSTFVSALSEYGSESAFARLQEESARITCRVMRDGKVTVLPIGEIVVGDAVLLQAGERVPADGVLLEGELSVEQAALNGEGREVKKRAARTFTNDLAAAGDLFRGSVVCAGSGVLSVTRVGGATLYGGVAGSLHEAAPESPLKTKLSGLAAVISRLGYAAAVLVALADLFHAFVIEGGTLTTATVVGNLLHAVTLAVSIVVVAVPEGLPMMITVVLSANMRKMLRDQVLVRRPVGIETAGSLNILFTDKTGTLTEGRLAVTAFVCGNGEEHTAEAIKALPLWNHITLSCLAGSECTPVDGRAVGSNATDRALTDWALPAKVSATVGERIAFDSARKWSGVHLTAPALTLIKGAPEKLLPACTQYYAANGEIYPLTTPHALKRRLQHAAEAGGRVLALAVSDAPLADGGFQNLTLVGVAVIADDVRAAVPDAVRRVRGAGIQTVMITGDNRETAVAIARRAGILADYDPAHSQSVITGDELTRLSEEELTRRLPALRVVARALPADKSRLVRAARACGMVVGMTGDGVNDAPALKIADVGFAMGGGTEVAKEAGDIVILDNNFASIARAVLYGRTIFKSIRKFIVFQLTMNLCAAGISVIGPFIGVDTPVTVIQMLWINLIMDTLAGLAFAGEPPLPEYMEEAPTPRGEAVLNGAMVRQILFGGGYTLLLCVLFLKWEPVKALFRYEVDPLFRMSAFFALFIFSGICNSFNARTARANPFANLRQNPLFFTIMAAVAIIQLLLLYFGGTLFRTAPLTLTELLRVLGLAATVIPADAIRKLCGQVKTDDELPKETKRAIPL